MRKKVKISSVGLRLIFSVMLIVLPLLIMLHVLVRQEVRDLSREVGTPVPERRQGGGRMGGADPWRAGYL